MDYKKELQRIKESFDKMTDEEFHQMLVDCGLKENINIKNLNKLKNIIKNLQKKLTKKINKLKK